MFDRIRAAALALCLAGACSLPPTMPPSRLVPVQGDPSGCPAACERFESLGCPEAEPTPDGATCVDVCRNAETSGYLTVKPSCIASAESCDEARECM